MNRCFDQNQLRNSVRQSSELVSHCKGSFSRSFFFFFDINILFIMHHIQTDRADRFFVQNSFSIKSNHQKNRYAKQKKMQLKSETRKHLIYHQNNQYYRHPHRYPPPHH